MPMILCKVYFKIRTVKKDPCEMRKYILYTLYETYVALNC